MELISPAFLGAAVAVAAPIVIHLLFRRRARRVDIGTLRFLKIVLQDNAHRRNLKRWLLLSLRMLALLLLALMFARPWLRGEGGLGSDRELVLLVDQSGSMSATFSGPASTRWDKALATARERLKAIPEGTVVHVGFFDETVHPQSNFQQTLAGTGLKPSVAATDYGEAFKWARDLLWRSRRGSRQLVMITDLQKSGMRRTRVPEFPAEVQLEIVDVGRTASRNAAVVSVQPLSTEWRAGEPLVVTATVFNTSVLPVRDLPVTLNLSQGSKTVDQQATVSLAGGGREQVQFSVSLEQPGLCRGSVKIGKAGRTDELALDDERWFAFPVRSVDKVLLVDGEPGSSVFGAETYFLEMALRLRPPNPLEASTANGEQNSGEEPSKTSEPKKASGVSPFEPVRIEHNAGSPLPDLQPYRVVVLANVAELSPDEEQALQKYVMAGGGLVIFGGKRLAEGAYPVMTAQQILPASVEGLRESGDFRVETWDHEHSLLAGLSDPQHGDLRTLKFRKVLNLKPRPLAKVLVKDPQGNPLLVEGLAGKGRVLFFAFGADRDWSDWPTHRLFVPFIHQTLRDMTGRLGNTGVREQVGPPGISEESGKLVVSNFEPRESELERISEAALRKAYKLPTARQASKKSDGSLVAPPGTIRADEQWETVLWLLLVVLVAETFLANRTVA